MDRFRNPYRPGAGHMPPYLAGRDDEQEEFSRLLGQDVILENLVLTGLRGVGKTVLLETFKPIGIKQGWNWIGTDLSESSSLKEERIAMRLLADLAVITSNLPFRQHTSESIGFVPELTVESETLTYDVLISWFANTPGLTADRLKSTLEFAWACLAPTGKRGVIFAYDEAQNLADHADDQEYPLSLLLDVFQSLQRKGIPFLLVLTGLPTLFPKLVDARTFAERMFRVVFLDQLKEEEARNAILKPITDENSPFCFDENSVDLIVEYSGGYPYFIQFICREVYDVWLQQADDGQQPMVPLDEITRKLDSDFFAGRWSRATDRQRELLSVISVLPNCDTEFTVQEVVVESKNRLEKPFSSSHVNQMLSSLSEAGLIYKNRHGKYAFAVPLLGGFIQRQMVSAE